MVATSPSLNILFPSIKYFLHFCSGRTSMWLHHAACPDCSPFFFSSATFLVTEYLVDFAGDSFQFSKFLLCSFTSSFYFSNCIWMTFHTARSFQVPCKVTLSTQIHLFFTSHYKKCYSHWFRNPMSNLRLHYYFLNLLFIACFITPF